MDSDWLVHRKGGSPQANKTLWKENGRFRAHFLLSPSLAACPPSPLCSSVPDPSFLFIFILFPPRWWECEAVQVGGGNVSTFSSRHSLASAVDWFGVLLKACFQSLPLYAQILYPSTQNFPLLWLWLIPSPPWRCWGRTMLPFGSKSEHFWNHLILLALVGSSSLHSSNQSCDAAESK